MKRCTLSLVSLPVMLLEDDSALRPMPLLIWSNPGWCLHWFLGKKGSRVVIHAWRLHPRKLTWNLKMMVSKRNLLFEGFIFRFHVKLQGCRFFGVAFAGHLLSKYVLILKNECLGWCCWDCTRGWKVVRYSHLLSHAQFSEGKDGKKQKCRFGFAFSYLSIT